MREVSFGVDAAFRSDVERAARTEVSVIIGQNMVEAMKQMLDQPSEIKNKVISLLKAK